MLFFTKTVAFTPSNIKNNKGSSINNNNIKPAHNPAIGQDFKYNMLGRVIPKQCHTCPK
jgi:hypothetical protein